MLGNSEAKSRRMGCRSAKRRKDGKAAHCCISLPVQQIKDQVSMVELLVDDVAVERLRLD